MVRYCDDCRQSIWPRTEKMWKGWFRCEGCGKMAFCHQGPDHLRNKLKHPNEGDDHEA